MTDHKRKSSRIQLGAAIAVTAAAALVAQPAPANDVLDDIGHFLQCFGWMLTDPARQVAECGAQPPPVSLSSIATPVSGPVYVPADTTVVPEEEEPPCTVGSC